MITIKTIKGAWVVSYNGEEVVKSEDSIGAWKVAKIIYEWRRKNG